MRDLRLLWVASALFLLTLLVGIRPLDLPMRATVGGMDMIRADVQGAANDCLSCDMLGLSSGTCHPICASATESDIAADLASPASRSWPSDEIVMSGRVIRPRLAPPRIS